MHDVIIIGAGPAGLTTAAWCDELGLDTLVLEERAETGGQLNRIYHSINNYPGLSVENGAELRDRIVAQTGEAEFDLWTNVEIERIDPVAKTVRLRNGEEVRAICLVIATGVRRRQLGIPGEAEFYDRGVAESANRDREFLRGKDVCVVGGGDAAVENALMLAEICPTVTLVHRGANLRARQEFTERLKGTHCITVFRETVLRRILGRDQVDGIEIQRAGALKPTQIAVQGVLIRIGVQPNTDLVGGQLALDEGGYVIVDRHRETNLENVFAIGDVSNPIAPTIAGAVGDGASVAKFIAARLRGK
jgi:thioredoxin reductase (NADPH)